MLEPTGILHIPLLPLHQSPLQLPRLSLEFLTRLDERRLLLVRLRKRQHRGHELGYGIRDVRDGQPRQRTLLGVQLAADVILEVGLRAVIAAGLDHWMRPRFELGSGDAHRANEWRWRG